MWIYIFIFIIVIVVWNILISIKEVKLFVVENLFSFVAPTDVPDPDYKYLSDRIYNYKIDLENSIQSGELECTLNTIPTYDYNKIDLTEEFFLKISKNYTQPVLITPTKIVNETTKKKNTTLLT